MGNEMIVKNLTFTVPPSIWDTKRSFILLEVDKKDRNLRALLRWNPVLTKATYKIKMVNGTTKEYNVIGSWICSFNTMGFLAVNNGMVNK